MNDEVKKKKGIDGELALNRWFQSNGMSYLYINQSPETFASLFQNNLKRPDFLVLIESIGIIAVDAKHYTPTLDGKLTLKLEEEVRRVMTFERLFRLSVWYAYYFKEEGKEVWYWISALKAIETGTIRVNSRTEEQFLVIPLSEFSRIESNADFGKLYTQRLPALDKIKRS